MPDPFQFTYSKWVSGEFDTDSLLASVMQNTTFVQSEYPFKEKPLFTPVKSAQTVIDEAVREALEKPRIDAEEARRVAEIDKRVELATKLGNDDYAIGTVIKFNRRLGQDTEYSQSKSYSYAAFKAGDGNWYLTGQQQNRAGGWKWTALVEWLVTGDHVAEDIVIAGEFKPVITAD